jgi:hypothetical protein
MPLVATGAGVSAFNGTYVEAGSFNGRTLYQLDSTHEMFWDNTSWNMGVSADGWSSATYRSLNTEPCGEFGAQFSGTDPNAFVTGCDTKYWCVTIDPVPDETTCTGDNFVFSGTQTELDINVAESDYVVCDGPFDTIEEANAVCGNISSSSSSSGSSASNSSGSSSSSDDSSSTSSNSSNISSSSSSSNESSSSSNSSASSIGSSSSLSSLTSSSSQSSGSCGIWSDGGFPLIYEACLDHITLQTPPILSNDPSCFVGYNFYLVSLAVDANLNQIIYSGNLGFDEITTIDISAYTYTPPSGITNYNFFKLYYTVVDGLGNETPPNNETVFQVIDCNEECFIGPPLFVSITPFQTTLRTPPADGFPVGYVQIDLWRRIPVPEYDQLSWVLISSALSPDQEITVPNPYQTAFDFYFASPGLECQSGISAVLAPHIKPLIGEAFGTDMLFKLPDDSGYAPGWSLEFQWKNPTSDEWEEFPGGLLLPYNDDYVELILDPNTLYLFRYVSVDPGGNKWPGNVTTYITGDFTSSSMSSCSCITSEVPSADPFILSNTELFLVVPPVTADISYWRLELKNFPSTLWEVVDDLRTSGISFVTVSESCNSYEIRWVGVGCGDMGSLPLEDYTSCYIKEGPTSSFILGCDIDCYWSPPAPVITEISGTHFTTTSPSSLPTGMTLTLQIRQEGSVDYIDYQSGIGANELVDIFFGSECTRFYVRWIVDL